MWRDGETADDGALRKAGRRRMPTGAWGSTDAAAGPEGVVRGTEEVRDTCLAGAFEMDTMLGRTEASKATSSRSGNEETKTDVGTDKTGCCTTLGSTQTGPFTFSLTKTFLLPLVLLTRFAGMD